MKAPDNLTLRKYAAIIFFPFVGFFLYFYFREGFDYYLTGYCYIICLMTGSSYTIRDFLESKKYYDPKNFET